MQEAAALGARVILGDRKSNVLVFIAYPPCISLFLFLECLGNDRKDLGFLYTSVADADHEPGQVN